MIAINGVALPTPSECKTGFADQSKAERNARGRIIIERVRGNTRKLELTWSFLNAADLSKILIAVSPTSFSVTYFDPLDNANRTGTFYAGDRSTPFYDFRNGVPRYKDVKVNLIEV